MGTKFKYFPNDFDREFRLFKECQKLAAEIFRASADAPKGYRFSICKEVSDRCCNLVHSVRLANSYQIGSKYRKDEQEKAKEYLLEIQDLLPVLRRCRCITIGQEGEITKKVDSVKFGFEKWLESDHARIDKMGEK